MRLLFYSNPIEPVTKVLLKNKDQLNIVPLYVRDLLEKGTIFDELDEKHVKICWNIPGIEKITNSDQTHLINRVFYCPKEWFEGFEVKDRKYAHTEWNAYLHFALDAFPNKTEAPGAGGLTGSNYSLVKQWTFLENKFGDEKFKVPEYYIGSHPSLPKHWQPDTIICSKVFNFYQWKPNIEDYKDGNYTFFLQRPEGKPYLCLNTPNLSTLHSINNKESIQLDPEIQTNICRLSQKIHKALEFFVSETLFFVKDDEVMFGMSQNYPLAASKVPDFENRICQLYLSKDSNLELRP